MTRYRIVHDSLKPLGLPPYRSASLYQASGSLLLKAFIPRARKGPNKQNTRPSKHRQGTIKKSERTRLPGQQVTERLNDANLSQKQCGARELGGGEMRGRRHFFFYSWIIFFQKQHFNQGSGNYETCQLIARVHQTGRQVTRNENLDPQIGWASKVPDNHCHKSSRRVAVGGGGCCRAHAEMGDTLCSQVAEAKPTDAAAVISNAAHHCHYGVNADAPPQ